MWEYDYQPCFLLCLWRAIYQYFISLRTTLCSFFVKKQQTYWHNWDNHNIKTNLAACEIFSMWCSTLLKLRIRISLFQALSSLQDFDEAINDFKTCLQIDPNNKAAKNQLTTTQQAMKKHKAAERQRYSGMFTKFASIDSKVNWRRMMAPSSSQIPF